MAAANVIAAPASDVDYGEIEIIRDEAGIPHIFSNTDEGAMFGLGYATAEDRAFQMTFSLRTVQGRLAETMGDVKKTNRDMTTVEHDVKMRTIGFYRAAKEVTKNLNSESLRFLQAYANGVNDYIKSHREDLLYLFEEMGVEPETWKPEDCVAAWWNMARFFAPEGLHDLMSYHRIKDGSQRTMPSPVIDDSAAVVKREDVSDEWIEKVNQFMIDHGLQNDPDSAQKETNPKFSHAWVVGGSKTTTGSAVVCSDPQTPVRNPSLFYEFHMQGKTFNARGMGVPGSPIILIGWNENVAWGVTALGADQADLFMLKTDPDKLDQYFFENEWRDMEVWEETVKVKGGEDISMTMRATHFGPVANRIVHDVREGEAVSLKRIPVCDETIETIQSAIAMWRAGNANELDRALSLWRFPSMNTVFGDKDGNCGYRLTAAIPIRSPHAVQSGRVAVDGSIKENDWQGFFPGELLPHMINPKRGYALSGNHRAIESFYPSALGVSTGASGDSDRSWRLRQLLQSKESFTPEDVLAVHYDSVNAAKKALLDIGYHLRNVQNVLLGEGTYAALKHLEAWHKNGAQSRLEIPGTELANQIPLNFRIINTPITETYGGGFSGLCFFLKTEIKALESNPDYRFNVDVIDYVDNALASAWAAALNLYGDDVNSWNAKAAQDLQRQSLPYFQTLDQFPGLDQDQSARVPGLSNIDGGTIFSQRAQSYTQWVPLHDVDSARSLLPIGVSEHPDSPYRSNNVKHWEKGFMRPAPITRGAVEAIAKSKIRLAK